VLFPLHATVAGVNVSLGDSIVVLLTLRVSFLFLTARIPVPPFLLHLGVLGITVAVSLVLNALLPRAFFSLSDAAVESLKLLGVAMWLVAVYWLLRVDIHRRYLRFALTSVAVAMIWSVATVYQNVLGGVQRPSGPFENANIYGNYLVLNVALALGASGVLAEARRDGAAALHRLHRSSRWLLRAGQPLLLLGIFSTGSRGALLGYAAVIVCAARLWWPRRVTLRGAVLALAGGMLTATAVGWFFQQNPYLARRLERTSSTEHNVAERFALWSAAEDAWFEHPVIGVGYGQFRHYASYTHDMAFKATHQTYLSVLAELGLPGLLAFLWLLGAVIAGTFRWRVPSAGSLSTITRAFVVASCVQGLVANVDQFRSLWIAIGLVAALGSVCQEGDAQCHT
jgi:O-antigen ligase